MMDWEKDHMNAVIKRWTVKYHESGMTAEEFSKHIEAKMIEYGWAEPIAAKMAAKATREK